VDQRRFLLFIAVASLAWITFYFTVVIPYQKQLEAYRKAHPELFAKAEEPTTPTLAATTATAAALRPGLEGPTSATLPAGKPTTPTEEAKPTEIVVHSDLYRVVLTSRGGRPKSWIYYDRIPGHQDVEPIEMIPQRDDLDERERELPFEVVFKESNRLEYPEFNTGIYDHTLTVESDGSTRVVFVSPVVQKLQLVKTYVFRPGDYLTSFEVVLRNLGEKATCKINDDDRGIGISWGPGVREFPPEKQVDLRYINLVYGTPKFVGHAALRKPKEEKEYRGRVLWAGATDKFFLAAIIPRHEATAVDCVRRLKNEYPKEANGKRNPRHSPPFTIVVYGKQFDLGPRRQVVFRYDLFVGPKRPALLGEIARKTGTNLGRVLFYGSWFSWMRGLKLGLMYALNFLYSLVGNYGLAIVILTILIRVVTHPIAHKGMKMQAKTMAEMQKIKPLLDEVNRKYKSDPAKRNQEMMKLYKEHNISPLAPLRGCLPMLIQIPIFFALYSLLNQCIDLRGASFLWIEDLSAPDKLIDLTRHGLDFYIPLFGWHVTAVNLLPILMGASQYLMSKFTPTPGQEPSQKQMMLIFTLFFPVLLYNFPSGLFIYWLINNVWQTVHQLIANRGLRSPSGSEAAAKA